MEKEWILVMDSGMGGLWTLNELKKVLPNENYIYFMDKTNCPYGNKSVKRLQRISENIIRKIMLKYRLKLIILACNTLSSVAYNHLTKVFAYTPIVKISPYFSPEKFNNEQTLVLATTNTIRHNAELKNYKNCKNVHLYGFDSLAKRIDENKNDLDVLLPYLHQKLKQFKSKNIKNIVLGCTHFNYIKTQLISIFGNVKFFENSKIVAQISKKTLKKIGKFQNDEKKEQNNRLIMLYKI